MNAMEMLSAGLALLMLIRTCQTPMMEMIMPTTKIGVESKGDEHDDVHNDDGGVIDDDGGYPHDHDDDDQS